MDLAFHDFNGADQFFAGAGAREWADLQSVILRLRLQIQPSGQANKVGDPIFDPKATNARLTAGCKACGWKAIPVPAALTEFGLHWDAGKNSTLAEFQFSNYPFLWNNVIRTEGVYRSRTKLAGMASPVDGLVIVTKAGNFPASNSTLYYEQAKNQLTAASSFAAVTVPIRLVGLILPGTKTSVTVDWNEYPNRYGRVVAMTQRETVDIATTRGGKLRFVRR